MTTCFSEGHPRVGSFNYLHDPLLRQVAAWIAYPPARIVTPLERLAHRVTPPELPAVQLVRGAILPRECDPELGYGNQSESKMIRS